MKVSKSIGITAFNRAVFFYDPYSKSIEIVIPIIHAIPLMRKHKINKHPCGCLFIARTMQIRVHLYVYCSTFTTTAQGGYIILCIVLCH